MQSIPGRRARATASDRRLPSLSAILPMYNEEPNVVGSVEEVLAALPAVARWFELVVVDDGSSDLTGALADGLARAQPGLVRVVRHARNRGYGAALRSGFAAAQGQFIFYTDGDGQFDPRQLGVLVDGLTDGDVVVGYRSQRADRWHRRVTARAWNGLVRAFLRVPSRDVNCAFKLLPRAALTDLGLTSDGAAVSAELLARLCRRGHRVVDRAVVHRPRAAGTASGARPAVVLRALRELIMLRWRLSLPGSTCASGRQVRSRSLRRRNGASMKR